ncbi:MAG: tetratricopeptide repeat protein [Fimbriimonadales bacterium]|nr:tetratricopeptide repeat protein [Fimbriimonadales bacterium]
MKGLLVEQVEKCIRQGKVRRAIRLLRQAADAGEAPLLCYRKLAELYRMQRQYQRAIWALRQAMRHTSDHDPLRTLLIEVMMESGDWNSAVQECRRWLRESPDHPIPLEHLMDAYWHRMEFQQALEFANRLVQLQPTSPHYRLRRARLLDEMGRRAQAVEEYQRLAVDISAPLEVALLAQLELERLDRQQLEILMPLLMEDPAFRLEFMRNPVEAVRQRGFRFSAAGEEMLIYFPEEMRLMSDQAKRYGSYS